MTKRPAQEGRPIRSVKDLSPRDRERLEISSAQWQQRFEARRDAIAESERLTEADLDVRINTLD